MKHIHIIFLLSVASCSVAHVHGGYTSDDESGLSEDQASEHTQLLFPDGGHDGQDALDRGFELDEADFEEAPVPEEVRYYAQQNLLEEQEKEHAVKKREAQEQEVIDHLKDPELFNNTRDKSSYFKHLD